MLAFMEGTLCFRRFFSKKKLMLGEKSKEIGNVVKKGNVSFRNIPAEKRVSLRIGGVGRQ